MKETLERIYWDHRQGLYTLALAITRRPERAEDAVQDAFARLWTASRRPTGDPVPYVFAAVRNAAALEPDDLGQPLGAAFADCAGVPGQWTETELDLVNELVSRCAGDAWTKHM